MADAHIKKLKRFRVRRKIIGNDTNASFSHRTPPGRMRTNSAVFEAGGLVLASGVTLPNLFTLAAL